MKHLRHHLPLIPLATIALLVAGCGGNESSLQTTTGNSVVTTAARAARPTMGRTSINFAQDVLDAAYASEMEVSPEITGPCGAWHLFEPASEKGQ